MMINLITTIIAGTETGAAFVATMGGLEGFSVQAADELGRYGIQVHAVKSGSDVVENVMALLVEERDKP
jgi:NAD(P)-dependent dehydrogenase (short-subunit alcohol dehydrogenase family)